MSDIELKHYDNGGGAPAIVFVHGFCCLPDDWADQVIHFAETSSLYLGCAARPWRDRARQRRV